MFKKFINGLIFGSGFAIAFTLIAYLGLTILTNIKFNEQTYSVTNNQNTNDISIQEQPKPPTPFHDLSIEDKIKASSVIALIKYEKGSNGEIKTVIKDFLKKDNNVTIYYKVGDEYKSPASYQNNEKKYGDGVIAFFQGSPAEVRYTTTFYGNRILGLSDLPIELLRNKCKQ